jgi:tetratricopeptide (TPR) repeat protein
VYRHLVPAVADVGDFVSARRLFDEARRETPDDPTLGPLEVMLTLEEGNLPHASERARFWLAWLRRRGLAQEMQEAVEFLELAARDPEAAQDSLDGELDVQAVPLFAAELRDLVAKAVRRPVRPYPVVSATRGLVFEHGPKGVAEVERQWAQRWPVAKPLLTSLDIDPPIEILKHPRSWLDFLRRRLEAFDSLEIVDDLVLLVAPITERAGPELDGPILEPLLERALEIVRSSLRGRQAPRVAWGFEANRPALRLVTQAALRLARLDRRDEAAELFEWLIELNPDDNQCHRGWLVNHYLKRGDDERALAVSVLHADDTLVDTSFGRALALWRLGRREEAAARLAEAARQTPRTARALLAADMPEPELSPYGVEVGGEDEAWIYREEMLETWRSTAGALECLAGVPLPAPQDSRRRSRRPAKKKTVPGPESF